jgi:hypothetical protein
MEVIYSLRGRPYRRVEDLLWDAQGTFVGWFNDDELVFGPSGAYLGEIRPGGRLGYRLSRRDRKRGERQARSDRPALIRSDREPRDIPEGWEEFRGPKHP